MTPILYHYSASPFGELVRVAFGVKGLAWGSRIVPNILPKPDQTIMTGGYARTPVVQIGADIHCDTGAILPALEACGGRTLYPAPLGALHKLVASWANGPQFWAHVAAAMGNMPAAAMGDGFVADRQARFGMDLSALGRAAPHLTAQALVASQWLSETLAGFGHGERAFIGGDAPGAGDVALYSNLWFVKAVPFAADVAAVMLGRDHVADWFGRLAGFGHGERREVTADEALAAAQAASPAAVGGAVDAPLVAGMLVAVSQEGTKDAPSVGRLLRCDSGGVVIAREISGADGQPVTVHVHFPRLGQVVVPV